MSVFIIKHLYFLIPPWLWFLCCTHFSSLSLKKKNKKNKIHPPLFWAAAHLTPWALWLLRFSYGAVLLRFIFSQGWVGLGKQDGSTLQGSLEQEPLRGYQVPIALRVGEGITRPTGADTPDRWTARCRWWQHLLSHHISHLQRKKRDKTWDYRIQWLLHLISRIYNQPHLFPHLVVDSWTNLQKNKAKSHHRQNAKKRNQEDCKPHIWLV